MKQYFVLMLIQFIGLLICAIVLRNNLPNSILETFRKNSTRLNGRLSSRRQSIERQSLDHVFLRVYAGLTVIFIVTAVAGMATPSVALTLPDVDAESRIDVYDENAPKEAKSDSLYWKVHWPLAAVYFVSTVIIAPFLIASLYRSALDEYQRRSNLRFMDYYRREAVGSFQDSEGSDYEEEEDHAPMESDAVDQTT